MLALRQFPPLANVELGELANLADNLRETILRPDHQIVSRGALVPALHLVIEGRIEADGEVWGPRDVFGLLEVLAARPATSEASTTVETRTFQISAEDALELLEDNFGLLRSVLRELARRLIALGVRPPPAAPLNVVGGDRMTLVDRVMVLRRQPAFANGRLHALAAIARAFEPRRWRPGELVARAAEPAEAAIVVLEGSLRIAHDMRELVVGPGGAIGMLEMLAGTNHATTVEALSETTALWLPVPALVDVLEDHTDFALAMTTTLASLLLDASVPQAN
jgi:CRP-like cAMP-binding protein